MYVSHLLPMTLPHVKQRTGMIMLTTEADARRATSVLRSRL